MTAAYIPVICAPPFPVVVASFFILGLGMAINLAMGNVFAANLQNSSRMLGSMHGSYGIGGTIGPLIATAMVTKGHILWSRYYILTLAFAVVNLFLAGWSFWNFESDSARPLLTDLQRTASAQQDVTPVAEEARSHIAGMKAAFKSRTVVLGALFIFAYQGAEVSISGWVISFLINYRHGNPASVGYVTSGFWGGITFGRFFLTPLSRLYFRVPRALAGLPGLRSKDTDGHPRIGGEKTFVYFVVVGAAVFELLVWLVPNVIGDAVAVAFVGLLLGPVYPCATIVFTRLISRADQVNGLSLISAFGSSGGAVAPFITGVASQAVGTFVLHPVAIGLFGVMMVCWISLRGGVKRIE